MPSSHDHLVFAIDLSSVWVAVLGNLLEKSNDIHVADHNYEYLEC